VIKQTFSINKSTGIQQLLTFIKKYFEIKNILPPVKTITRKLNLSEPELYTMILQLENMGNFERKIYQTYIKKTRDYKESKNVKKLIPEIKALKLLFLKSVIFIIGCISLFLSIYFTYLWFINILTPVKSFFLSTAMVGFSVTAFEIIILFRRNKQTVFAVLFSILWFVVLCFSMSTSLSGQLNLEFEKLAQETERGIDTNNSRQLFDTYSAQVQDLKTELNSKREERLKLKSFLSEITNYNEQKQSYKDLNYRIISKNKDIQSLRSDIKVLESKKEGLLLKNVNLKKRDQLNFFTWLSDLFGVSAQVFRFILFLAPALFLDIIAPLSFAIVLFFKEKD